MGVSVAAEGTYLPLDCLDLLDVPHTAKYTRAFAYTIQTFSSCDGDTERDAVVFWLNVTARSSC